MNDSTRVLDLSIETIPAVQSLLQYSMYVSCHLQQLDTSSIILSVSSLQLYNPHVLELHFVFESRIQWWIVKEEDGEVEKIHFGQRRVL